jgi:hypothetical protein
MLQPASFAAKTQGTFADYRVACEDAKTYSVIRGSSIALDLLEPTMRTAVLSPGSAFSPRPSGVRRTRERPATAPAPVAAGWLSALAAWAERQPPHRRLGSWTVLR